MSPRRAVQTALILLSLGLLAACASDDAAETATSGGSGGIGNQSPQEPVIEAVATTTQIGDFLGAVGGDRVAVTQILEADTDPHGFEPSFSDVSATADADVVLINGEDLDPWAETLVSDSGSDARVIDLSEQAPHLRRWDDDDDDDHGHDDHGHDSEHDPHWWHDPRNAAAAVKGIGRELARLDPEGSDEYIERARKYAAEIEQLDAAIEACVNRLPAGERKLITDHEAFSYLASRYDLDVVGTVVPAITTQAQPSARDISRLIETIERLDVKAIFPEDSVNTDVAEAIADETGVDASRSLYGDALGPPGSDGETYLGMMSANAEAIVGGLSSGEIACELL